MQFATDNRAGIYRTLLALVMILAFSFTYAVFYGPASTMDNVAENQTDGTHYEEYSDAGTGTAREFLDNLPIIVLGLAVLSALVWAVITSSVG